jgi:hypothetical protein
MGYLTWVLIRLLLQLPEYGFTLKKDYKGDKNTIRWNVSCLAEGSTVSLCSKRTGHHVVRGR